MSLTRTTTSETGPFYASGAISFSSLRTNFKRSSSGSIKASELRRNTNVNTAEPVVPDCTENRTSGPLNGGISTSSNLRLSQFRNSIKYYDLDQGSDTDTNLNIAAASLWNSNLQYNIEKRVYLSGISGSTNGNPAASLDAATVYNVLLLITGSILGTGGSAGTETTDGGDGGNALFIDTNSTGTVTVRTSGASAQVYGGGGGGGGGGDGGTGGGGQYSESYTEAIGTGYSRGGPGDCGCPSGNYCSSTQRTGNGHPCCGGGQGTPGECFCCFYDRQVSYTVNTNGGAGGDGADGGLGEGYLQSRTFGPSGAGGSGGGRNAGTGGQGGDGGDGGTYGQDGEDGETGDTGSNGNRTGGSAGATGTSGGTAGRAVAGSGYTIDTANGVDSAYLGLK